MILCCNNFTTRFTPFHTEAGFPWWIIVIVVAVCLIILIVALVFARRKKERGKQQDPNTIVFNNNAANEEKKAVEGFEKPEQRPLLQVDNELELGQKAVTTEDEGLKGKGVLAVVKDRDSDSGTAGSKTGSQILNPPLATIEDAIHKPKDPAELPETEKDQEPETNDEMLEFDSEGVGSKAGSLSSLESFVDEDVDFANVAKWGPRFGKLNKMLGEYQEEEAQRKAEEEIEDNFLPTQEEDSYYLRCFQACDENNTGHVTCSQLLKVLEWMNENPFGERQGRVVDSLYVEGLRQKYDVDDSYTFDYPEFINLMKGEKIAFAEILFKDADTKGAGKLHKSQVEQALKRAGFVRKITWDKFLDKFDKDKDGLIDYDEFTAGLREFFAREIKHQ